MKRRVRDHHVLTRLLRRIRHAYLLLMRAKAPPHATAMGLAIGVFIGFLPIIPFQTVTAVGLALVLRCGKIAAALGTWVTNPFNVPLVYISLYKVGIFVLPLEGIAFNPRNQTMGELLRSGWDLFWVMGLGGVLLGLPSALVTYFVALMVVRRYHAFRARRRLGRK